MKPIYIFIILFILPFSNLQANGIGIIDGSKNEYLQVIETQTTIFVQDQIATITCTQILKNTSGADTGFKYGFPLKEKANPTNLRWKYGEEWKTASVSSKTQDSTIPSAGGEKPNPILKEYLGEFPFFFTPKDTVANDSIIIIELTYVELLPYYQGKVSFFQKNNYANLLDYAIVKQSLDFTLTSEREILNLELLDLEFDIETNNNQSILHFNLDEQLSDFDYSITYELASNNLGINAISTFIPDSIFSCDTFGNGYFTFIIEPESNVNTDVIEKNFSLIIDRSGSMSGNKIVQAKDAASFIIQNLNPGDYFNIIDFSSSVSKFSDEILEFNVTNENAALAYIDSISAQGSTNISEALTQAINQFEVVQDDKANIIIFMTDGNATAGETSRNGILKIVKEQINLAETEIFLFSLGIGENLDQGLLTLLARQNNGLVKFIDPEHLNEEMVKFSLSINNPVLLNTSISIEPNIINEIYPFPLPNLYKGEQLILSGRYDSSEQINIHLEGTAFNLPVAYDFQIALSDTSDTKLSFLPKIWAKQKLDALSLDHYLVDTQIEKDSISNMIDSLSSCYGVIALEFSSFEDNTTVETDEIILKDKNSDIHIYPSPCVDHLFIKIESLPINSKTAHIQIYNVQGKLIDSSIVLMENGIIHIQDLENLPLGIYFAIIEINNTTYHIKFCKI